MYLTIIKPDGPREISLAEIEPLAAKSWEDKKALGEKPLSLDDAIIWLEAHEGYSFKRNG